MIEHYQDYSANERTYLAWVRTALAIGAFGFIVDKYSLWAQNNGASGTDDLNLVFNHARHRATGLVLCRAGCLHRTIYDDDETHCQSGDVSLALHIF